MPYWWHAKAVSDTYFTTDYHLRCVVAHNNSVCTSDGDELVEDISWSRTKRGPTLAELLRRVEVTGWGFVCKV